ncbi:MAG: M1 family aminopeptidase [Acidobacteriota bacterium]
MSTDTDPSRPKTGVPLVLAQERASRISDLHYELRLRLEKDPSQPILGSSTIRFAIAETGRPIYLDFAPEIGGRGRAESWVSSLTVNGEAVEPVHESEHVELPAQALRSGTNEVVIDFVAGDTSLNRQEDFLYTLFVPDRARTAVPIFDQPDLKARYTLSLDVPAGWEAVANGAEVGRRETGERIALEFAETLPIPTYLFAFAAGKFEVAVAERAGRTLRLLHRESDAEKVARNLETVFDLHGTALEWLEDYTGIDYPFAKLDVALIPAFQYGGMEHVGSIFYRDRSLFLDDTPTQSDLLGRASLIAHEVAHMWFGNLVTMTWFDDVWLKEVMANLFAAKIVHPSFPEVDHDLRFLLAHHPRAYGVDRTAGAHPIRQELDNLAEAGSLYGAIIYQKAPIVLRQLEERLGEERFRAGLRRYLERYSYGNATWQELVAALAEGSELDLSAWSNAWVSEPGRPQVAVERSGPVATLRPSDPGGRSRSWPQSFSAATVAPSGELGALQAVEIDAESVRVDAPLSDALLPDATGLGYGDFVLDEASRAFFLEELQEVQSPLARASAWLALWDDMQEGRVAPERLLAVALRAVEEESNELLLSRILGDLRELYWRFLNREERQRLAPELERALWERVETDRRATVKSSVLRAYRDLALTDEATARLAELWRGSLAVPGVTLSPSDRTALVVALSVRAHPDAESMLEDQLRQLENVDQRRRLEFLRGALSARAEDRTAFFANLADPAARAREPWVLEALRALHHPLRAESAIRFLPEALELLEEVQRTGDIFFPLGWLSGNLSGHSSSEAVEAIDAYVAGHPDLSPKLLGKLEQAADPVRRAAR